MQFTHAEAKHRKRRRLLAYQQYLDCKERLLMSSDARKSIRFDPFPECKDYQDKAMHEMRRRLAKDTTEKEFLEPFLLVTMEDIQALLRAHSKIGKQARAYERFKKKMIDHEQQKRSRSDEV